MLTERPCIYCEGYESNIKAVAREFDVSPSRISRIQGEIERGYLRDSELPELLKRYKVQD